MSDMKVVASYCCWIWPLEKGKKADVAEPAYVELMPLLI